MGRMMVVAGVPGEVKSERALEQLAGDRARILLEMLEEDDRPAVVVETPQAESNMRHKACSIYATKSV